MAMAGGLRAALYDRFFKRIHSGKLIYNTCWEDPRADRTLLGLGAQSTVALITSAGCNALDYLLDDPRRVHCVDMNPRQNALLELKVAAIGALSHEDFFAFFGRGAHPRYLEIYRDSLRPNLSVAAQAIWDEDIHAFDPHRGRGSFYYHGTSGDIAWGVRLLTRTLLRGVGRDVQALLDANSLDEQREIYARIEPKLFGATMRWLVRQPMLLSLLGVPRAQRDLMDRQFPGGTSAFVQTKLRELFTTVPVRDNYFWRVYLTGRYRHDCCPNYLRECHYATLRARVDRLRIHTDTFAGFLHRTTEPVTHFVLLDHLDWLAANHPVQLEEECQAICAAAAPQARVLLRSAALQVDFLPSLITQRWRALDYPPTLHTHDRVGTYGSTVLAELR